MYVLTHRQITSNQNLTSENCGRSGIPCLNWIEFGGTNFTFLLSVGPLRVTRASRSVGFGRVATPVRFVVGDDVSEC